MEFSTIQTNQLQAPLLMIQLASKLALPSFRTSLSCSLLILAGGTAGGGGGGGGDPSRPKPNRSGYNFFFAEKHSKLKSLYPEREREFTKMIGESWTNLSQEDRMVYQSYGLKDKERYQREMKEYKERINLRQQQRQIEA